MDTAKKPRRNYKYFRNETEIDFKTAEYFRRCRWIMRESMPIETAPVACYNYCKSDQKSSKLVLKPKKVNPIIPQPDFTSDLDNLIRLQNGPYC